MGDRGGARHPHSLAAPGSVYRVEEKRGLQRGVTPHNPGALTGEAPELMACEDRELTLNPAPILAASCWPPHDAQLVLLNLALAFPPNYPFRTLPASLLSSCTNGSPLPLWALSQACPPHHWAFAHAAASSSPRPLLVPMAPSLSSRLFSGLQVTAHTSIRHVGLETPQGSIWLSYHVSPLCGAVPDPQPASPELSLCALLSLCRHRSSNLQGHLQGRAGDSIRAGSTG